MSSAAKRRLPRADDLPDHLRPTVITPDTSVDTSPTPPRQLSAMPLSIQIEIPIGMHDEAVYASNVSTRLKGKQSAAMKRLVIGLRQAGETTDDGQPVAVPAEAVRWLAERIAQAIIDAGVGL